MQHWKGSNSRGDKSPWRLLATEYEASSLKSESVEYLLYAGIKVFERLNLVAKRVRFIVYIQH
jgi:hypothetical protein